MTRRAFAREIDHATCRTKYPQVNRMICCVVITLLSRPTVELRRRRDFIPLCALPFALSRPAPAARVQRFVRRQTWSLFNLGHLV